VRVKEPKQSKAVEGGRDVTVEIQIVPVVFHTLAEAVNVMTRENPSGDLNEYEKNTLKVLNRTMTTAGLLLDQLHQQRDARLHKEEVPFEDTCKLKRFLCRNVCSTYSINLSEDLEWVHDFLAKTKFNTPKALRPVLEELGIGTGKPSSDGKTLDEVLYTYAPFRIKNTMRIKFGIMAHILSKTTPKEDSDSSSGSPGDMSYLRKCEILLSSVLWLQDLSDDEGKDTYQKCKAAGWARSDADCGRVGKAFKWLMSAAQMPEIMEAKKPFSDGDKKDLDIAWNWIESSQASAIFIFLRRVTKIGLLRNVKKDWKLISYQHDEENLQSNQQFGAQ
jgi:hypothetical protein